MNNNDKYKQQWEELINKHGVTEDFIKQAHDLWDTYEKENKKLSINLLQEQLKCDRNFAEDAFSLLLKEAESNQPKSISLIELFKDKPLFSKVVSLMQRKESYDFIINYLNSKNKSISKGSLSNLKTKMVEAEERGVPLEDLLDRRRKTSVKDLKKSNIIGFSGKNKEKDATFKEIPHDLVEKKVYSNQQVFESIIKKGMDSLANAEFIDTGTLIKAAELNEKYYGSKTGGLTTEAFKQYQLIIQAEIQAITQTVVRYVPESQQQEALDNIDKEFNKIISDIGKTEDGQTLLSALKKAGAEL